MPARRFPPPWAIEEHNDACFIVKDRNVRLFEEEPGRRTQSAARINPKLTRE